MNSKPSDVRRISELIHRSRRIQLVTHVAPDGDAIGSLLGLGWLLRGLGKQVAVTCQDPVPDAYAWLPGSDKVIQRASSAFDLVISLDCSDPRRMGDVFEEGAESTPLINVDHHVTNTHFGTINWVEPTSVATAQMVLDLADTLGWDVSQPVAQCLLTGIVTDTRSFRTSNVEVTAFRAALRLMEAGASIAEITRRALDQLNVNSVLLWGDAIERMMLDHGILSTDVTRAMRRHRSLGEDGTTGLINFLSGIREADVVVVFNEREDGTVDVGMRAIPGYDVSQLALRLGGGGHPQASGCTLDGGLEQVREQVLQELRIDLAVQRTRAGISDQGG